MSYNKRMFFLLSFGLNKYLLTTVTFFFAHFVVKLNFLRSIDTTGLFIDPTK